MARRGTWAAALALAVLAAAPVSAQATATHCCSGWGQGGQIAVPKDGRNVYVADANATLALKRGESTGALELIDSYDGGGTQVELSPDERHVYVTGTNGGYGYLGPYGSGQYINVFTREPTTGALSHAGRWRLTAGASFNDIEFRDDRTLYVTDYGRDAVMTLTRDPGSGRLDFRSELRGDGIAGPAGLAVGPSRLYAYQSRVVRTVTSFHIGSDGSLTPASDDCDCDAYGDLELSPDGSRLAAGPFGPYAFTVDAGGMLEELPADRPVSSGGYEIADGTVAFGPEGRTFYTGDRWDSGLIQMANAAGGVTFTRRYYEGRDGRGIEKPRALTITPDGRWLYATSEFTQASYSQGQPAGTVSIFRRDPDSGELTFDSLFTGPVFDGRPHHLQGIPPKLEINGGAAYTNDPDVMLSMENLGPHDHALDISNDGGFKDVQKRRIDETNAYPWKLASTGPDRLPKTVYVRVIGISSYGGKPFTDDIILDETAPTIVSARAASSKSLKIKARDKLSGVSHVQVTRNPRRPGKWKRFTGTASVPNGRGGVRVRVRDRAKNSSRWKVVP